MQLAYAGEGQQAGQVWASPRKTERRGGDELSTLSHRYRKRPGGGPSSAQAQAQERAVMVVERFAYGNRRGVALEEQRTATLTLARCMEASHGTGATAIGLCLRQTRYLSLVLSLLYVDDGTLQILGAMILANLVSDSFDAHSFETKRRVLAAGVFERLRDFVFTRDERHAVLRAYACACVQNLVAELAFAQLFQKYELVEHFEALLEEGPASPPSAIDDAFRRYAAGALSNLVSTMSRAFNARSLEQEASAPEEADTEGGPLRAGGGGGGGGGGEGGGGSGGGGGGGGRGGGRRPSLLNKVFVGEGVDGIPEISAEALAEVVQRESEVAARAEYATHRARSNAQ